ncbi:UNVERIFIED_CONTAM: hypothetical protein NCL1_13509 [Trichonephila clavipes]
MSSNPLSCDCSFKWIVSGTEHNPEKYITGMCDSPKEMKGRELIDLVPYDFSCCSVESFNKFGVLFKYDVSQ